MSRILETGHNPHRYGGGNIDQVPDAVKSLALFFRRTAGSITNKMLNLDGSRSHSSRLEPLLYATLAEQPDLYASLYHAILSTARDISLGENALPDFLHGLGENAKRGELLGQYELPSSSQHLLREAGVRTVDRNRELLLYCPEEILAAFWCELRFFAQNAHLSLVLSDKPLS
jgi:hypothetical protein